MRKIISTLNIFLRQEWISVGVYFLATALFIIMIFNMGLNENPGDFSIEALTMISMLSFFVGIYIGSGFLKLQQSYLWLNSVYSSALCWLELVHRNSGADLHYAFGGTISHRE